MKSGWNPPGQAYRCDRIVLDIAAVKDDHITGIRGVTVDADKQPAIILARSAGTRHEHRLAVLVAFRHPVPLHPTTLEIIAHHAPHLGIGRLLHGIQEAIGTAGPAFIDARQFDTDSVKRLFVCETIVFVWPAGRRFS